MKLPMTQKHGEPPPLQFDEPVHMDTLRIGEIKHIFSAVSPVPQRRLASLLLDHCVP